MRLGLILKLGGFCYSLTITSMLLAQDTSQNAPVLNAFGRFWGIGYSQGYHTCDDGRYGWGLARDFHASPTPHPALTAMYTAPQQPFVHQHFNPTVWPTGATAGIKQGLVGSAAPTHSMQSQATSQNVSKKPVLPNSSTNQARMDGQKSPSDRPIVPPRPTSPPPEWLKRYLPPDGLGDAVLLDGLESQERTPNAQPNKPVVPSKTNSTNDELLIPTGSADELLSPQKSSRAPRPAPIFYVPTSNQTAPKTARGPQNVWLSPDSPVMQ